MDFSEFEKKLNPQDVKGMLILQGAMTMGVVLFAGVTFFFSTLQEATEVLQGDLNTANLLLMVLGFTTFMSVGLFVMFPKIRYKNSMESIFKSDDPVSSFMGTFRGLRIIQIALLEGAALFGVVTCFLNVINGVIAQNGLYWIGLIPAGILIVASLSTLPTATHLYNQYKSLEDNYSRNN